jgi:hypothetical protein
MVKTGIMVTENFALDEYRCKCEKCNHIAIINDLHSMRMQALRYKYGNKIIVTSGTRCGLHNAEVGGVPDSLHLFGNATDIIAELLPLHGHLMDCVAAIGFEKVIEYKKDGIKFIHLGTIEKGVKVYVNFNK